MRGDTSQMPALTSCPLRHSPSLTSHFILLMHHCITEFISTISTLRMKPWSPICVLPSWFIKSQDHCQDQFPLLIAFNELLENISCVSLQRQLRWTFSPLFIPYWWKMIYFSYSWIFLSLVSAPDPPNADCSPAVLVFNWYSRGWADWIQSLKLSSKFLV